MKLSFGRLGIAVVEQKEAGTAGGSVAQNTAVMTQLTSLPQLVIAVVFLLFIVLLGWLKWIKPCVVKYWFSFTLFDIGHSFRGTKGYFLSKYTSPERWVGYLI